MRIGRSARRLAKPLAIALILIIAPFALIAIGWRGKDKVHVFSFPATADSYVSSAHPTELYGTGRSLRTAGKVAWSYLRFDVTGLVGRASRTTLRLYAQSPNKLGFSVNAVQATTWDERKLSYPDAPPVGRVLGQSGPTSKDQWVTVDLLPPVDRNGSITLALTAARFSSGWYASRETGAAAPQLIIQTVTRRAWPAAEAPAMETGELDGLPVDTGAPGAWGGMAGVVPVPDVACGGHCDAAFPEVLGVGAEPEKAVKRAVHPPDFEGLLGHGRETCRYEL